MSLEHDINETDLAQMMNNVAKCGSTTIKYRVQVMMPAITYGYIEVEALNEEEAYELADDKIYCDIDCVEWTDNYDYDHKCIEVITQGAEALNLLVETGSLR